MASKNTHLTDGYHTIGLRIPKKIYEQLLKESIEQFRNLSQHTLAILTNYLDNKK